jgi:hypothetical protein
MGGGGGAADALKEGCSFLKKRTKRLLRALSRTLQAAPTPKFAKVFCFFFSKKKAFLLLIRRNPANGHKHPNARPIPHHDGGHAGALAEA